MRLMLSNFKMIALAVMAISFWSCDDDEEAMTTTPVAAVSAGYTFTVNQNTGIVTFINTSEGATSYLWDFGDNTTSKEVTPEKTYPNGEYIVKLTASNDAGTEDVFQDTVKVLISSSATLPFTFDEAGVTYNFDVFNGAAFEIVDNPDQSGTNDKASKVGKLTNVGAEFEGVVFTTGTATDLSTLKTISMNFWSDEAVAVLLKLEEGDASVETSVNHAGSGWETLKFNFTSAASFGKITLFADGPGKAKGDYFVDDVTQEMTEDMGNNDNCIAETTQSLSAADFNVTFQTDPAAAIINDGSVYSIANNPDADNSINNSCKVGQVVRNASLEFANNQIVLDSKIDFSANAGFKMKVYSAQQGYKVTVKLEDKDNNAIATEVSATTTVGANEWEELTFNFPATESGKYNKIVLFFDLATFTSATYFMDDLRLVTREGGNMVTCTAETVQSLAAADFNLSFQTDPGTEIINDGGTYSFDDNPDADNEVNKSCKVGKVVRDASLQFANNQIVLDAKLDFMAKSGFKLKVYSPQQGYKVTVKLEDKANGSINTEVSKTTTVGANEWEELTFDFPGSESGKYDKIVLFFDLSTFTAATYYFDDFMLYGTGSGDNGGNGPGVPGETGGKGGCNGDLIAATALPLNFEGCETFLSDLNFGNGLTSGLVTNPSKSDINNSDYVLRIDKPTGSDFFAGVQNIFPNKFDLTTTMTFKTKVYSTKANVVFRFELAVNPNPEPVIGNPAPIFKTIENANEWTEVEFTFTNLPGQTTDYNQLVIKPDNDMSDSPITNGGTYYVDDIVLE